MASTYVNDLRLNEMATGDGSGTWGTTTNTNLELIAEAFSYGTEVITTNADTHTTTIADGSTDPGRSLYLKYTGTLDSACTITIGPNTVSKVWIVENGTSGSQDIILSQGSGANITIPAGDTKVVYSDGAGAGAAFFDAFASLSVVDLKVQDDLTVTDDASIGGDATITGTLGVTGNITGTLDTAAQTNITSVGTLTGLTVTGTGTFPVQVTGTNTATSVSFDNTHANGWGSNIAFRTGGTDAGYFGTIGSLLGNTDQDLATYATAGNGIRFYTNGNNERLRIDASGNVGIAAVPSGEAANAHVVRLGDRVCISEYDDGSNPEQFNLFQNSDSSETYIETGTASVIRQRAGEVIFYNAASGTAGDVISFTERLRVDSSGNVNITSNWLQLFGNNTLFSSSGAGGLIIQSPSGADTTIFRTSATTERFRIAANARLAINASATANAHGNFVGEVGAAFRALSFENTVGGGECGTVTTTASTTSYNTTSDYRLKENVVPMTGSIDRVKALKPSRFNFIVDADKTVDGFLAHEAQEVVPECVTGTKDAMRDEEYEVTPAVLDDDGNVVTEAVMGTRSVPEMQGIDQSKLVPLLTAALQEAITKIEDLTTRLETLENA
jgi:hypothetical protein